MLTGVEFVGALSDQRIHTAYAGTDGGFGHDVDGADLTDVVDVRTTAQLTAPAILADGDHTHDVAVLFAEQVHGTQGDGVIELHFLCGNGQVITDAIVHSGFDGVHHGSCRSLGPLEIEAQTVRSVLGSTLGGLRAEFLAQSLMNHVGGGVGTCDGTTTVEVDVGVDLGAHHQRAFGQAALMHDEVLDWFLHIIDFKHGTVVGKDLTLVGELTTGLRIERSTVEDDLDVGRTGDGRYGTLAFLHDADHAARADISV